MPLTYVLLAAIAVVFVVEIAVSPGFQWTSGVGRVPKLMLDYGVVAAMPPSELYRLVTAGFLHASVFHLAFNSWALYQVGHFCERRFGAVRLGIVYAVALVAGNLLAEATAGPRTVTVGASGAIMGLFAAMVVVALRYPSQRPALSAALLPIVLTLVNGFATPGISNGAHIGGAIAGLVAAYLVGIDPEIDRRLRAVETGVPPPPPAGPPDEDRTSSS